MANKEWTIEFDTSSYKGKVTFSTIAELRRLYFFRDWLFTGTSYLSQEGGLIMFSANGTGATLADWLKEQKVPD